jgi:hypothetical protein
MLRGKLKMNKVCEIKGCKNKGIVVFDGYIVCGKCFINLQKGKIEEKNKFVMEYEK